MPKIIEKNDEKRRHPRLAVNLRVEGLWTNPLGVERPFKALLVKVSESGALLRCGEPITVNSIAEFVLKVDPSISFRPQGRVRWWRRNGEVRDIGLEFDPPIPAIGRFIKAQLGRTGRKITNRG